MTGLLSSADGNVYFDLDNNEMHCDRLVSTDSYESVKSIVVDVSKRLTGPGSYATGMQVYNTTYPDKGVRVTPASTGSKAEIGVGWTANKMGLRVRAATDDGREGTYTSGISQLELAEDGIVTLSSPGGNTGLDAKLVLYPGYYGNQQQGYNSKVELTGYTIDVYSTSTSFSNNITVGGSKSRKAPTENYDDRLLYCYEMPSPMFGDIGDGITDEEGVSVISIDDIFAETIRGDLNYQVFLQKCGPGELWVEERTPTYFVVKGTPNMKFSWELKAKQAGYETERLEREEYLGYTPYLQTPEELLDSELSDLIMEQEAILYETA